MINITQHGDEELVDLYLNDEFLFYFACTCGSLDLLRADAEERYIFSQDQWDEMVHYYTDPEAKTFMM